MTLPRPILARRVPGAGRGGPPRNAAAAGDARTRTAAGARGGVRAGLRGGHPRLSDRRLLGRAAGVHGGCWPLRGPLLALQGKVHRVDPLVDPDFGSTLTVSNRDSHSNCWVNWKIMGQPCEFQVFPVHSIYRRAFPVTDTVSDPPDTVSNLRH